MMVKIKTAGGKSKEFMGVSQLVDDYGQVCSATEVVSLTWVISQ